MAEEGKIDSREEFVTKYVFQELPAGTHVFLIAACAVGSALCELPAKYGLYALLPVDLIK